MLKKITTKLSIWLIKRSKLSLEQKAQITSALLENIGALPIRDVIEFDYEGTIKVGGQAIDMEKAILIKTGAKALRDNFTRKVLRDQMKYNALMLSVTGTNIEQIMFAKAANWVLLQEEELLKKLDES